MARKNADILKIDKIIGQKITRLRIDKGMSREELARFIDVTHQQLQKYEKGINRISVGRLVLIAQALESPIQYFYENLEKEQEYMPTQHQRMCIEVSRNFMKIVNGEHQSAINSLVKSLATKEVKKVVVKEIEQEKEYEEIG
jgi:transcriptional regulator with XRE-family HTH domain